MGEAEGESMMNKTLDFMYKEAYRDGFNDALRSVSDEIEVIKRWQNSAEYPFVLSVRQYILDCFEEANNGIC